MRYLAILAFLLTSWTLSSQTTNDCDCNDRLMNLSVYYQGKEDYQEAIKVLNLALSYKDKDQWTKADNYRLGDLWRLYGDNEKATAYIGEALKLGFDVEYLNSEKYDELKGSIFWKDMLLSLDSLKREHQRNVNFDYRLALEDIRGSDQTIRRLIKVPDSTFVQLDSINFNRVKKLLKVYGYPSIKKHGFDDNGVAVYLVLLHASMYSGEDYEEILDILDTAITDCLTRKSLLAQFIDRREVWYNKELQIYGTWNNYRAENFKEIRELHDIDKLRFEYNLLRLEEQSVSENRKKPEGYIKNEYPANYFCGYKMKK